MTVAGNLKHFLKAWQILTGDQEILAIVKDCHFPFLCQPHQKEIPMKINFSQKDQEVNSSGKENLLKKVAIEPVCVESQQEKYL